jgi:integrase
LIVGVTTAATLWLVTVIGLCFGGGQLVLGTAATLLGLLALWVLKWVEDKLRRERTARFAIDVDAGDSPETEIRRRLRNSNLSIWQSHRVVDAITMNRIDAYRMIRRRTAEAGLKGKLGCHVFRATGITAYLEAGGTLENAQAMAAHESPRATKLYDRTGDEITLDEVERITI